MSINGNIVRLTTTYSQTGITISTSGINADVLKYLRNTYNDGLTFEITSYFNTKRVDANGNTYDFAFGLNWSGTIRDERVATYTAEPLTTPESITFHYANQ